MDLTDALLQMLETKMLESSMDDRKRDDALDELLPSVEGFSKVLSGFFDSSDAFEDMAVSMLGPVFEVKGADSSDYAIHARSRLDFLSSALRAFEREPSVNKLKLFEIIVDNLLPSLDVLTPEESRVSLGALSVCLPKMREMGFEEAMNLAYNVKTVLRNSRDRAVGVLSKLCVLVEQGMNPNAVLRKAYELGLERQFVRSPAGNSGETGAVEYEGRMAEGLAQPVEDCDGFAWRFLLLADMTITLKKLAPDYKLHSWALIKGVDELIRATSSPAGRDAVLSYAQEMLEKHKINPYWIMCYVPSAVPDLDALHLHILTPLCESLCIEEDTSRREAESRGAFRYGITMLGRCARDWREFEKGVGELSSLVIKIRAWSISSEVISLAANLGISDFAELAEVLHYLNSIVSREAFLRSLNYYLPIELNLLNRKLSDLHALAERLSNFDGDILGMICQRLSSSDISDELSFFALLSSLRDVSEEMRHARPKSQEHEGNMKQRMYARRAIASYIDMWKHLANRSDGANSTRAIVQFGKLCASHPSLVTSDLARHLSRLPIAECEKLLDTLCKESSSIHPDAEARLRLGIALAKLYRKYDDYATAFSKVVALSEKNLSIALISNAFERVSDASDVENVCALLGLSQVDANALARAIQSSTRMSFVEMRPALRECARLGNAGIDASRELIVVSSHLQKKGIKGKAYEALIVEMSNWFERLSKMGCMPIGAVALAPLCIIPSAQSAERTFIPSISKALLQLEELLLKTNSEDRALMGHAVLRSTIMNYEVALKAYEQCISHRKKKCEHSHHAFNLARQVLDATNYGERTTLLVDQLFSLNHILHPLLSTALMTKFANVHPNLELFSTYLHDLDELSGMCVGDDDLYSIGCALAVCMSSEEMDALARQFKDHLSARKDGMCALPDLSRLRVKDRRSGAMANVLDYLLTVSDQYSYITRALASVCEDCEEYVESCKAAIAYVEANVRPLDCTMLKIALGKGNNTVRASSDVVPMLHAIRSASEKLDAISSNGRPAAELSYDDLSVLRCGSSSEFQDRLSLLCELARQCVEQGLELHGILCELARASRLSHELSLQALRGSLRLLSAKLDPSKYVAFAEKSQSLFGRRAPEVMAKLASAYLIVRPEDARSLDRKLENARTRSEVSSVLDELFLKWPSS